jgi:hypothetical protein
LFADAASKTMMVIIRHFSKPIRNASGHCWRIAKLGMSADKIIIPHVKRDREGKIFDLF